ncbi:MAG: hypothetical protein F4Z34_01875 [Acidimicrobiaceae bacterium]|nr:hypothetical protein [Acidimicrobiaceae bacterium]
MRSLRLATAIFALALIAAACSDDENGEEVPPEEVTTTTGSAAPTTTQPRVTTPTTAPPDTTTTTVVEVAPTTSTTAPPDAAVSIGPPPPPSNVRCQAGTAENELLVAFDALPNPADISKIRVYVSVDGGPMITNGEYTIGEIDSSGDRWAAPARRLPANVPLRLAATSFNQLGQESGWYIVEGNYTGPGAPCGEPLPPPTATAGFGEEEGEQGQ